MFTDVFLSVTCYNYIRKENVSEKENLYFYLSVDLLFIFYS